MLASQLEHKHAQWVQEKARADELAAELSAVTQELEAQRAKANELAAQLGDREILHEAVEGELNARCQAAVQEAEAQKAQRRRRSSRLSLFRTRQSSTTSAGPSAPGGSYQSAVADTESAAPPP